MDHQDVLHWISLVVVHGRCTTQSEPARRFRQASPAAWFRQDVGVTLTAYLAPAELEHELRDELAAAGIRPARLPHGRLVLSDDAPIDSAWAANIWRDAEQIPITSIGDGAKQLRERQRNWAMYAPLHHGRAKLIADKLPHVSAKPVDIGGTVPAAPLGSWTLLEPDLMVAAADCSSPFANGEA